MPLTKERLRCFYVNLPLGVLVFIIIVLLYRPPRNQRPGSLTRLQHLRRLDPIGLVLFVGSMICLIFALQLGGGVYHWSNPRIIALLILFGIFLVAFAVLQVQLGEEATLPPRVVKDRTLIFASFFVLTIDGAYYAIAYYVSL